MASNLSRVLSGMDETVITATNEVITVDPDTRQLNIPGIELVFGVEGDGSSERKYFQFPRYVGDNLDLAGSFLRVNYRNANGDKDFYLVNDVAIEGDSVVFSWKIHEKVVAYKGQVRFVVCVVGPDLKVKWHTTLGTGISSEGLEPDANLEVTEDGVAALIAMVEQQTTAVENVGAEWVRNVQSEGTDQIVAVQTAARDAQSDAVAQIEAKGVSTLATIPGDYTATVNAVQSAANALRKKVSGEVIRVDDVSPMEHYPVVKVAGKNLFYSNKDFDGTLSGISYSMGENTSEVTFSGTANKENALQLPDSFSLPKGTYSVSVTGLNSGAGRLYLRNQTKGEVIINHVTASTPRQFTLTEDANIRTYIVFKDQSTYDNTLISIQIENGETVTEYTPYIDPTTVTVTRCGKNLTAYTGETKTDTSSGISIVRTNNSAEFLVNGTATAMTSMVATSTVILPPGTYTVSVEGLNSISTDTDRCYLWNQPAGKVVANGVMTGKPKTFTISEWTPVRVEFVIGEESSYSNKTVKIQIEQGENATNYEPYTGETQIPTDDGTVSGLSAVSPTMTLLTDTTGVNIECEYSRDINVAFAEILEKITALGG